MISKIIVSIGGLLATSIATAVIDDTFSLTWVKASFWANPAAFLLYTAAAIFAGMSIWALAGAIPEKRSGVPGPIARWRTGRYLKRVNEETERAEFEKFDRDFVRRIKGMSFGTKAVLCRVYDNGFMDMGRNSWLGDGIDGLGLFDKETLPGGKTRLTVRDDLRAMLDRHPELLEEARKANGKG